jgi:hypothetical protein
MPSVRPTRKYDASHILGCHLCHTISEARCATCCEAIFCAHCLVGKQYHTLKQRRLGATVLEDMIRLHNYPRGRVGRPDDEDSDEDAAMTDYRNVASSQRHDGGLPCTCVMLACDLTCTLGCALLLGTIIVRGMLRDTFLLRGARCCRCCGGHEYQEYVADVCIGACCAPCSTCQVEQEMSARGCYDRTNINRHQDTAGTFVDRHAEVRTASVTGPAPQFMGDDVHEEPATTPRNPRGGLLNGSPPTQQREPSHSSPLDARGHPLAEIYGNSTKKGAVGEVEPAVAVVPAHYVLAPTRASRSPERTSSVVPMPTFHPMTTDDDESGSDRE